MSPEEEKRFDVLADRVMSTTAAALDLEIPTAPTAPSVAAAVEAVLALWQAHLARTPFPSKELPPLRCARGCSACCHQDVGVTAAEVVFLVDAITATLAPADLAILRQVVADRAAAKRGCATAEERIQVPCGLLNADGSCQAYPVRPAVCRGANSLSDPALCGVLGRPFTYWAYPQVIMSAAGAGIGAALHKRFQLDGRQLELTLALDLALREPARISRWLRGDPAAFHEALVDGLPAFDPADRRHLPVVP